MPVALHRNDLPPGLALGPTVALDTETMGLNPHRDRLCLVQLSAGDGNAHIVQFLDGYDAPNLKAMLADKAVVKICHYARFDIASIERWLGIACRPVWCTKIASRLSRTNTDKHGLKDLTRDLLGIELSKQQQTSDWGAASLSAEQLAYAASDVLHLHALKARLEQLLDREKRTHLAQACFDFLPYRAALDIAGWGEEDIFAH